jgi:hypothetical protein
MFWDGRGIETKVIGQTTNNLSISLNIEFVK